MGQISKLLLISLLIFFPGEICAGTISVRDALQKTKMIIYPEKGRQVNKTVAWELKNKLATKADVLSHDKRNEVGESPVLYISISDESFSSIGAKNRKEQDWMHFQLRDDGSGELCASKGHLLYALLCQIDEEWLEKDVNQFSMGKTLFANFTWLRGDDGFFAGKKRFSRGYDAESAIRELARMGCSNVVINSLATPFSLETGPPGEIYYRFYIGAPDLDQFTETELNKGSYPPEYLQANLNFLKEQARLAQKYGLTPGLYICNPRSVSETLLEKYPFLRGARVDHPFRSFLPRYNLTLGHPAVRWHYAQMLEKIMTEIPEISFINTFLNDSGSGFEYTARLYSGRNGGAYIAREWMTHGEFEQAAADNIVRYYRLLRETGRKINPDFHIVAGLFAIPEEEPLVMSKMDEGIDLQMSIGDKNNKEKWKRETELQKRGSHLYTRTASKGSLILGIPTPWLINENLEQLLEEKLNRISVSVDPPSMVKWDINREVLRSKQIKDSATFEEIVRKNAVKWAGDKYADNLIKIWQFTDSAVRNFPDVPLYSNHWAFEMYRFWVRPYVPDIGKIPESEREYYEKYTMATFNNPHRVDFGKDVLWDIITRELGENIIQQYDNQSKPKLEKAIVLAEEMSKSISADEMGREVFVDIRDRLLSLRCLYRSLRNIGAWVAGVHGYMEAETLTEKASRLHIINEMIDDELDNAKNLIKLWESTTIEFIPIHNYGETWHQYGDNMGELIRHKIALMEKHRNDKPYIDPDFMWRMPSEMRNFESNYMK